MKIGKLVKRHVKQIFQYCENSDHDELKRLTDKKYSKKTFGIDYPFCTERTFIPDEKSKRYWTDLYLVQGKLFRVSSQWVISSKIQFINYIVNKNISSVDNLSLLEKTEVNQKKRIITRKNSRYRGNAIGNAQNLLIRNILSSLGEESFNDNDWRETKKYFSNKCAYCDEPGDLVIEHAVPINRISLGEHRLGNLVPSCKSCNSQKAAKDYREFLNEKVDRIEKIERYMEKRNYVPLGDNEQIADILGMAYQEVSQVSERYISILNTLFPSK